MNQKLTFTAFLQDQYSKSFEKLAGKTDKHVEEITGDLNKLAGSGNKAARAVSAVDRQLDKLNKKPRKVRVDTSDVNRAQKEIISLQKEKEKAETDGPQAGGMGLGGLGKMKGFAIAASAIAAAGYTLKEIGSKAVEATAKYQRFQAVLANTLGSESKATQKMDELQQFASTTPYQVDELTASFVKLANQGFQPTAKQLTAMGDLAASTGKSFDQLTEAVLDAQTGEFERLKEFGILARQHGDKVAFSFKGQTVEVAKTSEAIRNYILSLGTAQGVTGAMAAISKTTGGQLSNLEDNLDLLYKTIGDRFRPAIDGSVSSLSKMVLTVKSWFEIPVTRKLQEEIGHLKILQMELNTANTSEARRKEILEEAGKLNPELIAGLEKEKDQYGELNKRLDEYIGKKREAIALNTIKEQYAGALSRYQSAQETVEESKGKIDAVLTSIKQPFVNDPTLTRGQKEQMAVNYLRSKASYTTTSGSMTATGSGKNANDEADWLERMNGAINANNEAVKVINATTGQVKEFNKATDSLNKLLGAGKTQTTGTPKGKGVTGASTSISSGGSSSGKNDSISGGTKIQNLSIHIDALIKGGFNVSTQTFTEGVTKAKDIVIEGLLTAVNNANAAVK